MQPSASRFKQPIGVMIACAAMLLLFTAVSWTATDSKGATYDEPYHALSAWLQLHYSDFRMDNENPPLWQYWASLLNGKSAITADFKSDDWIATPQHLVRQWQWGLTTLSRPAGALCPGDQRNKPARHAAPRQPATVLQALVQPETATNSWRFNLSVRQ
jgi:hypothetical protein